MQQRAALSGGNLPPRRRTAGHIREAGEIAVRAELCCYLICYRADNYFTIASVEEDHVPEDSMRQHRSGSLEQLAARLKKYYLYPIIYLQANILWFSGDSFSVGGSCEKISGAWVFA